MRALQARFVWLRQPVPRRRYLRLSRAVIRRGGSYISAAFGTDTLSHGENVARVALPQRLVIIWLTIRENVPHNSRVGSKRVRPRSETYEFDSRKQTKKKRCFIYVFKKRTLKKYTEKKKKKNERETLCVILYHCHLLSQLTDISIF